MLPENKFYQALMLVATIALVLGYAWLGSRVLNPGYELPEKLISATAWILEDRVETIPAVHAMRLPQTSFIRRDLELIERSVQWLGGLKQPVELVVDEMKKDRLLITDSRIEIGSNVVLKEGQLSKAILRVLLLQRASKTITESHLRLDVVSDVLMTLLQGGLYLESTTQDKRLALPELEHWSRFATTFSEYCKSEWLSADLAPLCRTNSGGVSAPSTLAFRKVLSSSVSKSLRAGVKTHHHDTARAWLESLKRDRVENDNVPMNSREFLKNEIAVLLPQAASKDFARLGLESADVEFDAIIETDVALQVPFTSVSKKWRVALRSGGGNVLVPDQTYFSADELKVSRTRFALKIVCEEASVSRAMSESETTATTIVVQSCDPFEIAKLPIDSLLAGGVEAFARNSPETVFYQPRSAALKIALKRGVISSKEKLIDVVMKDAKVSEGLFGKETSKWDAGIKAYRSNAPLAIMPYFRSQPAL